MFPQWYSSSETYARVNPTMWCSWWVNESFHSSSRGYVDSSPHPKQHLSLPTRESVRRLWREQLCWDVIPPGGGKRRQFHWLLFLNGYLNQILQCMLIHPHLLLCMCAFVVHSVNNAVCAFACALVQFMQWVISTCNTASSVTTWWYSQSPLAV